MKFFILTFYTIVFTLSQIVSGVSENLNQSTLIYKMNYNSYGIRASGGSLIIRNIETNVFYKSHRKINFSPFVIVENLPNGKYEIEELTIMEGGPTVIIRNKSVFNILEIDHPKNYYLGNYRAKKIKPILEYHIEVSSVKKATEDELFKQLKKKSDKWLDLEIENEKSLFKADRTKIEIIN